MGYLIDMLEVASEIGQVADLLAIRVDAMFELDLSESSVDQWVTFEAQIIHEYEDSYTVHVWVNNWAQARGIVATAEWTGDVSHYGFAGDVHSVSYSAVAHTIRLHEAFKDAVERAMA